MTDDFRCQCSSDGRCLGPDRAEHCPVKHGTFYEFNGSHVLYTNYYCQFFPRKQATREPTVIYPKNKESTENMKSKGSPQKTLDDY